MIVMMRQSFVRVMWFPIGFQEKGIAPAVTRQDVNANHDPTTGRRRCVLEFYLQHFYL
jgi:hypothetical protein